MDSYNLNQKVNSIPQLSQPRFETEQIERSWKRQQDIGDYKVNILSDILEGDSLKSKIIINSCLFLVTLIVLKFMNPEFVQDKNGNNDFKKNLFYSSAVAVTGFCISYFVK